MDNTERSPLHKPYKEDTKTELPQSTPNHGHGSKSGETKEGPKYSSFLFGEQFCNFDPMNQNNRKRHSAEAFEENHNNTSYYKKSKSSESPQSADGDCTSMSSDEDKDFSNRTTPNQKQLSPIISPTTSMQRDLSQYLNYPSVPFLKSPELKGRPDYGHYPPQSHHIRGDSFTKDFFSSLKPSGIFPYIHEDGEDRNDGLGSELLIAAYNNFVRKVVDETLDRTITFCEQPRNAISALERICSKAWPQLEAKRHRNRIRAYLKACRRNSKKNRGQINMKEPPMNALSAEARQMVAVAMNLVRKDIEQLREDLKRDNSPSVFTAKNGTLPPNLRRPEGISTGAFHHTGASSNLSNSSLHSTTKSTKFNDDRLSSSISSTFRNAFPSIPPLSKSSTQSGIQHPSTWLDPQYFSALMRFLPSAMNFKTDLGTSNGTSTGVEMSSNDKRQDKVERKVPEHYSPSIPVQPPAAHFAVAKYSPTLNEATSMLLEVRPLSQDDLDYFQRYQGMLNEAIDYVRGVSQMLMKKVEIIEGHFRESKASCRMTPLNCVNN